jgi:hypothetical protein
MVVAVHVLGLAVEQLPEAPVVGEAPELTGDRLLLTSWWSSTFSSASVAWEASERSRSRSSPVNAGPSRTPATSPCVRFLLATEPSAIETLVAPHRSS